MLYLPFHFSVLNSPKLPPRLACFVPHPRIPHLARITAAEHEFLTPPSAFFINRIDQTQASHEITQLPVAPYAVLIVWIGFAPRAGKVRELPMDQVVSDILFLDLWPVLSYT